MKKIALSLCLMAVTTIFAQEHINCGEGQHLESFYEDYPEALIEQEYLNELAQNYNSSNRSDRDIVTIPIVFHVNDPSDPEKVTLAQVLSAIDILNEDYNALNPDFSYVRSEFEDLRSDIGVEFCLASIDPEGNPTTGITYHVNSYNGREPDGYGSSVKGVEVWPTHEYLNIWIVNETEDDGSLYNSGWAFLPSDYWDDANLDGIVYNHRYLGYGEGSSEVSGTDSWQAHMARVLTHEVAHYFNLRHTFYNYCSSPGDFCDDTPYVFYHGSNNCEQLGEKCDGVALVNDENYMDYTPCPRMFTLDQKDRMLAALSSEVARRNNLWTIGNLEATGCYVNDVSIEENASVEAIITANPQPIINRVEINYSNFAEGKYTMNIYNALGGKSLLKQEHLLNKNGKIELDLSELNAGIYFLSFENEKGENNVLKLIKN